MPVAVSTITQSGQVSLPKQIREILGVGPHDQVAFLSDGERVEVVAVPEDPLTLGTREEFLARIAQTEAEYASGEVIDAEESVNKLKEKYDL